MSLPPFSEYMICTLLIDCVHSGPESQSIVKGYPVVVEYAERIHDAYFPDYQKLL